MVVVNKVPRMEMFLQLVIVVILLPYVCPAKVPETEFPSLRHIVSKTPNSAQEDAVMQLIVRLIGQRFQDFNIHVDSNIGPMYKDTFQLETRNSKVYINGTTGVAVAMGFYYYIKEYCGTHISWAGNQVALPDTFPLVNTTVTITSNDRFRYYQNVCTVSYSSVWWSWERWENEIDWMAMQGINFPLAFTAQELIWQRVFLKMGFAQTDLDAFFSGPAFLAWQRMGNLQGWGGPLPQSWHSQQLALQHQILDRMRSLGIIPILPAFAGHVPNAITRVFPMATVSPLSRWGNMPDNYTKVLLLDFQDPLFTKIGAEFIKEYTAEFGTDHVYNTDTFNEMTPKSGDPAYLSQAGATVFQAMTIADPNATWVMQGWLFLSAFWTDERIQALLTSVPKGKMIVLDLYSDVEPLYNRTKFYYGQPFIWCMLHDFGGTVAMYGALDNINQGPFEARSLTNSTMVGIGLTPEGINQNDVVYEFMMENSWRSGPRNISLWLSQYAVQRYGKMNSYADKAWQLLRDTVFNTTGGHGGGNNLIVKRPSLHSPSDIWYDPEKLYQAWDNFILAADSLNNDLFRYDLVDVTRQSLQVAAVTMYNSMMSAYNNSNLTGFLEHRNNLLDLLDDLEIVLTTDPHFLLGRWVESARACGVSDNEKDLYEYNAKNQITLWGPTGNILDYANKQWAGLIRRYYQPRWIVFTQELYSSLLTGQPFDSNQFNKDVFAQAEEPFTFSKENFPTEPIGDQIDVAIRIHQKYRPALKYWKPRYNSILKQSVWKKQNLQDIAYSYNINQ